jgi:starvation-inducible DNA-binding protein
MKKKSTKLKGLQIELFKLLASNYALYLKTQNFHWNVTGNTFFTLHEFFQKQYENLAETIDDLAERIRALEFTAPGSFKEFLKFSIIKDSVGKKSAKKMLEILLRDNLAMQRFIKQTLPLLENCKDNVTQDMLIERLHFHEKTIWMLKSFSNK